MNRSIRILAVDDNAATRKLYQTYLEPHYDITLAASGNSALSLVSRSRYDLYLVDLIMPGMSGIQFIRELRRLHPDAGVIVISRTEEIDEAVEAFREHPLDFLRKPVKKNLLLNSIGKNLELSRIKRKLTQINLQSGIDANCPSPVFGKGPTMKLFWKKVRTAAESTLCKSILISGESGVGKEIVARQIHRWSPWNSGPFIALNCGLLTRELAASELLGVEKGVATGVTARPGKFLLADKGTLFLDEIGELPLEIQPVLLRVLQDHEVTPIGGKRSRKVHLRIIAASNKDLRRLVTEKRFREDLFFRLSVVSIQVPPLREHPEDIPDLLLHFYRRHGEQGPLPLSQKELKTWMQYPWPGNIRQLENALINRMISGPDFTPESAESPLQISDPISQVVEGRSWTEIKSLIFDHVIKQCNGSIRLAARKLKMSKSTLWDFQSKYKQSSEHE